MVGRCAPKVEVDAQYAEFIDRLVAAAPPLSDERLAELRELIRIGRAARQLAVSR